MIPHEFLGHLIGILYLQTRAGSRDFLHGAKARAGKTKYREGAGVFKPYLVGAGKNLLKTAPWSRESVPGSRTFF